MIDRWLVGWMDCIVYVWFGLYDIYILEEEREEVDLCMEGNLNFLGRLVILYCYCNAILCVVDKWCLYVGPFL